jgi:hypothetical protein
MVITLLFSIAGGMLVVLGLARLNDIAWKFIRLVGLLSLGLTALSTAWVYREAAMYGEFIGRLSIMHCGLVTSLGAIALVVFAPLVNNGTRAIRLACIVAGSMAVAASCLITLKTLRAHDKAHHTEFVVAGQILSSWLLGSITLAWLLGHAYLTATKMTIAPLRYFSGMLSAAVAARIVFFVAAMLAAWLTQECSPNSVCTRIEQWWLIVFLRVGVGLIALAVFAYMVRDCVRLRATQSATGILYFASVMAYVGELASQYLTRELVWPI